MGLTALREKYYGVMGAPISQMPRADVLQVNPPRFRDRRAVLDLPGIDQRPGDSVLLDRSGNNYHGTITGAIWKRRPSGVWELVYDGNDYVELDAPLMNFTSGDFTLAGWVKTTNLTEINAVLMRGLNNTDGYYLLILATGSVYFATHQTPAASQYSASASGAVLVGKYYRLGVTRLGASVRIYRNGVDITSIVGSHTNPTTCARTVKIGIYDDKIQYPLIGQTSAITVIPAALTPAQMLEDFQRDRWLYPA